MLIREQGAEQAVTGRAGSAPSNHAGTGGSSQRGGLGGTPQAHPASHSQGWTPGPLCQGSTINLTICTLAFQEVPAKTVLVTDDTSRCSHLAVRVLSLNE